MDIERAQLERDPQEQLEQAVEEGGKSLDDYLGGMKREISEVLPILPLTEAARIDEEGYKDAFPQEPIFRDKRALDDVRERGLSEIIQHLKSKKVSKEEIGRRIKMEKEKAHSAEMFEKLTTALLYKRFLKEGFIVVRSSSFDDANNKVDTLMIDLDTGEIICAFDETTAGTNEQRGKSDAIEEINIKGGTKIKYGLGVAQDENDNQGDLTKSKVSGIPIFVVSMPTKGEDGTEHVLANFQNSNELSAQESQAASDLVLQAHYQAIAIFHDDRFPESLKTKAQRFIVTVDRIYARGRK